MTLWRPTRRQLISAAPLLLGAAALPRPSRATGDRNLRMIALGDWGRDGGHYQRHVAAWMDWRARHFGCDFVVTTGDNFYTYGVSSVRDPQWRTSYEDIYSPELRRLPWFPVAGNHDWGGSLWAQLDRTGKDGWHMPWLWHDIPGARFGRPDVHLFFIDTTIWKGREARFYRLCGQAIRQKDIARQRQWLVSALRSSCAPIKLVFGHHPIFTAEDDGRGFGMDDLNAMLIAARATAYVCGHDHCLYHIEGEHLDYICSGGGSEERPRRLEGRLDPGCVIEGQCASPRVKRYLARAGFTAIDIGADSIAFSFVDRDGQMTPPEIVQSRGNHGWPCPDSLPVDPVEERERTRASAKTLLPCASLF